MIGFVTCRRRGDTQHLKDLALDQFTNRPEVTRIETSIIFRTAMALTHQAWPRNGSQRLARLEFCTGSGRRKGWGLRDVRGAPLPCVTTVSTTSNLGLPRSVTSLGQSTSTLVLEGDRTTALCVLPGTELAFPEEVQCT